MSLEIFSIGHRSCDGDAATFARRVAHVAQRSEATECRGILLELVAQ
jgi:hypothetical protein